jgi:hypothetical protein
MRPDHEGSVRELRTNLLPGVKTDQGPGDDWQHVHGQLLNAETLVIASSVSALVTCFQPEDGWVGGFSPTADTLRWGLNQCTATSSYKV